MTRAAATDLRRTIRRTLPRFLSIASLMLVGVFALVGLRATGPDMRATAQQLYDDAHLADLSVTSPLGLDQGDRDLIASAPGVRSVQFGHEEDVLLAGTDTALRVMSVPGAGPVSGSGSSSDEGDPTPLSAPLVAQGRLPASPDEIALDTRQDADHALGDTISVERPLSDAERALADQSLDGVAVGDLLGRHTFTVVGFVDSAEFIDRGHVGQTLIGTGQLSGIAYVLPDVFETDLSQVARLSFTDTAGLAPYDDTYLSRLDQHRDALVDLLASRPQERLDALRAGPQSDLEAQRDALAQRQSDLDAGRAQWQAAQAQLDAVPAALDPFHAERQADLDAQKSQLDAAVQQIADGQQEIAAAQADLDALAAPTYTVEDRRDSAGYENYGDYSRRIDVLSNVFPVFLFAVALMVGLTTMTRMVQEERTTSGTYAALGYSPAAIVAKDVIYGVGASLLGAVLGVALGHLVLPPVVFGAYAAGFIFPGLIDAFHPWLSLAAALIAVGLTALIAVVVARRELAEHPAELLRPKAPRPGRRILLERVPPLWRRLSFLQKVTARNLFRYKARALMTILGIAGCVALLIAGIGLRDSITGIVAAQYDQIIRYDLIAVQGGADADPDQGRADGSSAGTDEGRPAAGTAPTTGTDPAADSASDTADALDAVPGVAASQHVRFEQMTVRGGPRDAKQSVNLLAPPPGSSDFGDFVHLADSSTGDPVDLGATGAGDEGVVISQKLGELLGIGPGDPITLSDAEGTAHTMTVGAVAQMYVEHYVFVPDAAYLAAFGHAPEPNAWLIGLDGLHHAGPPSSMSGADAASGTGAAGTAGAPDPDDVASALMGLDGMQTVIQVSTVSGVIDAVLDGLNTVILVMIVVALVLAVVVTFNLTNINVSERIRELSTIKVLGFYPLEVTMYIERETLALTVVGILAGWGLGAWLHGFMIGILPPDNVMLAPALHASNIAISAGLTLAISAVVMAVMHVRLMRIDMLDALKSVE